MSTTPAPTKAQLTQGHKKVIFASSLGTVFEWYDFFLYGSLAAIIAKQFFSGVNETTGMIFALLSEGADHLSDIRKRLKRLRYALEFIARDMKLEARKPYLKALSATQTTMGQLNDLHTAVLACQGPHAPPHAHPHADQATAVAVLKHRLALARQQAIEELAQWRQLTPPWA